MFSTGAAMLTPKRPIILPNQTTTWVSASNGTSSDITGSAKIWTARTSGSALAVWNKAAGNQFRGNGLWYFEVKVLGPSAPGVNMAVGVAYYTEPTTSAAGGSDNAGDGTKYQYFGDGTRRQFGTFTSYGASFGVGDIIGIAWNYNSTTGAAIITAYKNGVSQGVMFTNTNGPTGLYLPFVCYYGDGNAGSLQLLPTLSFPPPAGYTVWN